MEASGNVERREIIIQPGSGQINNVPGGFLLRFQIRLYSASKFGTKFALSEEKFSSFLFPKIRVPRWKKAGIGIQNTATGATIHIFIFSEYIC